MLKLNSALQAGKTLIILKDLNISYVNLYKTSHSKIEEFITQTKINALQNAKKKACDMLLSIGEKCGKTLFVQENQKNYYEEKILSDVVVVSSSIKYKKPETEYKNNISFKNIVLKSEVTAKFQITP